MPKVVIVVPEEAVLFQATMNTVWVNNAEGSFVPKMVEIVNRSNGMIEIKSVLIQGDVVT